MRKIVFTLWAMCSWLLMYGQSTSGYEYWFDKGIDNKVWTSSTDNDIQLSLDVTPLKEGVHFLTFRFKDSKGNWSVPTSKIFSRVVLPTSANTITKYQYWLDKDIANKQTVASADNDVILSLDVTNQREGLHFLTFRSLDSRGSWSAPVTKMFCIVNNAEKKITSYEYWFNDVIADRTHVDVDAVNPLELANVEFPLKNSIYNATKSNLSFSKDESGNYHYSTINKFSFRAKDSNGHWSQVTDTTFNVIVDKDSVNFNSFIVNPDALNGNNGWTLNGTFNQPGTTEHWSGSVAPYFSGTMHGSNPMSGFSVVQKATMQQTISDLPAGTYVLTAYGRGSEDIKLFMSVGPDTTYFATCEKTGGELWENAEANTSIKNSNNGAGYGWCKRSLIFTTDGNPFTIVTTATGSSVSMWFNLSNFSLKLYSGTTSLKVTLPAAFDLTKYKNSTLQVINKKTNEAISMNVSESSSYQFNGLKTDAKYDIVLKYSNGAELSKLEDISLKSDGNEVTLPAVKPFVNLSIKVLSPDQTDITDNTSIQCYSSDNQYLGQTDNLSNLTEGSKVHINITLNQTLGTIYKEVKDSVFTIIGGTNQLTIVLEPLKTVTITGVVKDNSNLELSNANVSVKQYINGKYQKDVSTSVDANGKYALTLINDSSIVAIAAPTYITDTRKYSNFNDSIHLGVTKLVPIMGTSITTNFTFKASAVKGDTTGVQNYYSDYNNIDYTVYNKTKNKAVDTLIVQYPYLIANASASMKDQLLITAKSRINAFNPVSVTVEVDSANNAKATFNLVERGAVKATYANSANSRNAAILYDEQGNLVKSSLYSAASATLSELADGNYSLISMAENTNCNTISKLSGLTEAGLESGKDFALTPVTVSSGLITEVTVPDIPELNADKVTYTGINTRFNANKTSVITGNYITLNANLDFREDYSDKVSDVNLIVDLPDNCSFIANSVMVGSAIVPYTQDANKITIALGSNYSERIRFCVTPTVGGEFNPTAYVGFKYKGKTVTQSIGSASFTASDISITVPAQTASKTIFASGAATAYSTVDIYDGETMIAEVTVPASGIWCDSCTLNMPYNLTNHPIYAKISTPSGLVLNTETKNVYYNISTIEVKTVTMINTAHPATSLNTCEYVTVFDFQHPTMDQKTYWYWPAYPDFTFKIDFTNNDTAHVSNVVLYVKTSTNQEIPLPAFYNKVQNVWVATNKFPANNLPVNVSVSYKANTEKLFDSDKFVDLVDYFIVEDSVLSNFDKQVQPMIDSIKNELAKNSPDYVLVTKYIRSLGIEEEYSSSYNDEVISENKNNIINEINDFESDYNDYKDFVKGLFNSSSDTPPTSIHKWNLPPIEITKQYDNPTFLRENGFDEIKTQNGNSVFTKITDEGYSYVDPKNSYKMSGKFGDNAKDFAASMGEFGLDQFANFVEEAQRSFDTDTYLKADRLYGKMNSKYVDNLGDALYDKYKKIRGIENGKFRRAFGREFTGDIWGLAAQDFYDLPQLLCSEWYDLHKVMNLDVPGCAAIQGDLAPEVTALYAKIDQTQKDVKSAYLKRGTLQGISLLLNLTGFGKFAFSLINSSVLSVGDIMLSNQIHDKIASVENDIAALEAKCTNKTPANYSKDKEVKICTPCKPFIHPDDEQRGSTPYSGSDATHVQDPSGYVYEAVSSNRLPDVTATIYSKSQKEDIYGDMHDVITKWDAVPYYQVNPQQTDANGIYAWDVPQGLWQVKYEKQGYETLSSEWLPVPPPQLDINVGMTQAVNPNVKFVKGYEEGINIEFDKYMLPATAIADNLNIVYNGETVSGTVKLLNEEKGYADDNNTYVSKIRFAPNNQKFKVNDMVSVTVKAPCASYLNMPMRADTTIIVTIEQEIKSLVSDESISVVMNENGEIKVKALPADAAKGRIVTAQSASGSIVSLPSKQATLDENGEATFVVNGELPGATAVSFHIDGVDELVTETKVEVAATGTKAIEQVIAPLASIISGSQVEFGTPVRLSSATEGAIIYYTTDGSCPCELETRKTYSDPITINQSMTIKAIAVKEGMSDSDVSTFYYYLKDDEIHLPDDTTKHVTDVADLDQLIGMSVTPTIIKSGESCLVHIGHRTGNISNYTLDVISSTGALVDIINKLDYTNKVYLKSPGVYFLRLRDKENVLQVQKVIVY